MKADQERVRNLLTDTVTLLCKNGLKYQTELRVQGVLGITLDNNDVFIVHINEKFGGDIGGAISIRNDEGDAAKTLLGELRVETKKARDIGESETPVAVITTTGEVVHRHRPRRRESSRSPALPTNSSQQHTLHRPIIRPLSREDSPTSVKHTSFLSSTGNHSPEPVCGDIVDVKVKMEDDDDVIIIGQNHYNRTETCNALHGISDPADETAIMQDSYPNLTIGEIQGSYHPFGDALGVSNSSTNSGVDDMAPPPIKRRATSGSTQDSFGGSSDMGPDGGGPFITGMMRNETISGDVAPQSTSAAPWDPSQMPDFGSLTAQDGQMVLDSTPGCSTWDTTLQSESQVSALATASAHTMQNTSDQSSESVHIVGHTGRDLTGQCHVRKQTKDEINNGSGRQFEEPVSHVRGSVSNDRSSLGHDTKTTCAGMRFMCPQCLCTFSRTGGLAEHIKIVHQKQARYQCQHCGKGYSHRINYLDHLATHSGIKRYFCSICQQQFTFKCSFKKHELRFHSKRN